jgi:hypothetical protein
MNAKLHFIVGIGRSGTTILSKLLNKYSDVHCMPEANFLVFFLYKYSHKKNFTLKEIDYIFEEIAIYALSHPMVGWEFDAKPVKQKITELLNISETISYQQLCIFIYQNFKIPGTDKEKAHLLIDKNPSYTIFINKISRELPESKFIFIIRDYRANILSRKQSVYLKSPNVAYNATRWKLYNEEAYAFYKKNNDKVILVKYEDLVSNYELEINRIIQFLNISPILEPTHINDQQNININDYNISERFKERFIKKYSDLNKELNPDRLNVWKEKLSEKEIKTCEIICASFAENFGYAPSYSTSFLEKIKITVFCFIPILSGHMDVFKDKIIYYSPIALKLNRLKEKYKEIGFL